MMDGVSSLGGDGKVLPAARSGIRPPRRPRLLTAALSLLPLLPAIWATCSAPAPAAEPPKWKAVPSPEEWDIFKGERENGKWGESVVEIYLDRLAKQIEGGRLLKADGELDGRLDGVGLTSLAALAYLGAGQTSRSGRFRGTIVAVIAAIEKLQKEDGRLADGLLNHALACLALSENRGMTGTSDAALVQKGLDFLAGQQTGDGGFPAAPAGKEADALAAVIAAMAFKSARVAGLKVEPRTLQGLTQYFGKRIDAQTGLVLGSDGKPDRLLIAGTAAALHLMGTPRTDARLGKLVAALAADPPVPDRPDFLYCFLGGVACFQTGGKNWMTWNEKSKICLIRHRYVRADRPGEKLSDETRARVTKLVEAMRSDEYATREAASRDALALPVAAAELFAPHREDKDPEVALRAGEAFSVLSARATGDPYAMAVNALSLEIYYRYLPMYSK